MPLYSPPTRRRLIKGALAGAVSAAASPALAADDTLRVVMRAQWNRLLTPVWINGQGPVDFGIDTGAAIHTIDRAFAQRMKLPPSIVVPLRGIVDPTHQVNPGLKQVVAHELVIGGAFRETDVDLAQANFSGDSVAGFVPGAMFTFLPTLLDFPGGQALIFQHGGPDLKGFSPTRLFIGSQSGVHGEAVRDPHLPIDVQLDGRTYRMILDTGAPGLVTLFPQTVRDSGLWALPGMARGGGGLTGGYQGKLARMKALNIAGLTIDRPMVELIDPATAHSSAEGVHGLIGMEALRRFYIAIDANKGSIAFRPNGAFRQALRYNRSGLEFGGGAVRAVAPASPAAKADVAVGDRIILPDTGPDTFRAFRWSLEDAPGTVVEFTALRGGERRPVRLVLEDLI
jgi:hypothetical protein